MAVVAVVAATALMAKRAASGIPKTCSASPCERSLIGVGSFFLLSADGMPAGGVTDLRLKRGSRCLSSSRQLSAERVATEDLVEKVQQRDLSPR